MRTLHVTKKNSVRQLISAFSARMSRNDPLEYLLYPSAARVRGVGIAIVVNHLLFCLLLVYVTPQVFDSPWLRLPLAATGLPLIFGDYAKGPPSTGIKFIFGLMLWLHLPLVFSFLFVMNDGNGLRMASIVGVIMIYYQVTDWRLATVGTALGLLLGGGLALCFHTPNITAPLITAAVIGFMWASALFLGWSNANLRREQLRQTVLTMKVVANDIRPGLVTMTVIGRALRSEATTPSSALLSGRLHAWGRQLTTTSNSLRANLNSQIANAHLLELGLAGLTEVIEASALVNEVCSTYPFRTRLEQACVRVDTYRDFSLIGSRTLFAQLLCNLIRNGLFAVAATRRAFAPGDLVIAIRVREGKGHITVADQGIGMTPQVRARAFDAFYSTNSKVGHGLGLTFCRQVIVAAGGSIAVESVQGEGATFTIELPLEMPETQPPPSNHDADSCAEPAPLRPEAQGTSTAT